MDWFWTSLDLFQHIGCSLHVRVITSSRMPSEYLYYCFGEHWRANIVYYRSGCWLSWISTWIVSMLCPARCSPAMFVRRVLDNASIWIDTCSIIQKQRMSVDVVKAFIEQTTSENIKRHVVKIPTTKLRANYVMRDSHRNVIWLDTRKTVWSSKNGWKCRNNQMNTKTK